MQCLWQIHRPSGGHPVQSECCLMVEETQGLSDEAARLEVLIDLRCELPELRLHAFVVPSPTPGLCLVGYKKSQLRNVCS